METLYIDLVRAFARGYERESEAGFDARVAQIKQARSTWLLRLRDKEMVQHLGPMQGGAVTGVRATYDHLWNFTSVAAPQ